MASVSRPRRTTVAPRPGTRKPEARDTAVRGGTAGKGRPTPARRTPTRGVGRRPGATAPGVGGLIRRYPSRFALAGTLLLTVLVYARTLGNGFIEFDDPEDILDNYSIRELNWSNLSHYFTTPLEFMYTPLASVSFAVDYRLGQLHAAMYHTTNLLLHLGNVVLVFLVARALTRRVLMSHIAALAFAIHPMNADAVAWLATRSNLLATLFSLATLLAYLRYTSRPGWGRRGACRSGARQALYSLTPAVALFGLAALSKPTAVALPVTLLLIDLYRRRPYWRERRPVWLPILDKLPFFAIAALIGMVAVHFRADTVDPVGYTLVQRVLVGCTALVTYLVKAVVPVHLAMAYAYPAKVGGHLAWYLYLSPVVLVVATGALLLVRPTRRVAVFGLGFFLVNILPSQAVWLIDSYTANRYAYLPYVGLFLIAGYGIEQALARARTWRPPHAYRVVAGVFAAAAVTLCFATGLRGAQWSDTRTIMTASIAAEPRVAFVYTSRGIEELNDGDYAPARADFEQTLRLDGNYVLAYFYLGKIKHIDGDDSGAIDAFNQALSRDANFSVAYAERGRSEVALHDTTRALSDFTEAIALDSYYVDAYYQRGQLELDSGDYAAARADLDQVVRLDPGYGDGWYYRGLAEDKQNDHTDACTDWRQAQSLGQAQAGQLLATGCR